MIDLHCHILPGVDDGSDSPDTSCRMAAQAARSGVSRIVATPHRGSDPARERGRAEGFRRALRRLQDEFDRWSIPIRLLPGSEVLLSGRTEDIPDRAELLTLNDTQYLLVEFYFDASSASMDHRLSRVEQAGLIPVIAHPERYFCVQENPAAAGRWAERGYLLQVNKGSLLGELGEGAYLTAALLLRRGLAAAIASDAHDWRARNADMRPLYETLERRFPGVDPALLLEENPRRILRGLSPEFD